MNPARLTSKYSGYDYTCKMLLSVSLIPPCYSFGVFFPFCGTASKDFLRRVYHSCGLRGDPGGDRA